MTSTADLDLVFGSVGALGASLDDLDGRALADRLRDLERVVRRAEAAIVAVLDTADRRGSWKVDGHASVRGCRRVALLTRHAQELPFHDFRICVQRWESLTDLDGTHDNHEAAHAGRTAHGAMVGNTFHSDARGGALDGAALLDFLRRFERAQFEQTGRRSRRSTATMPVRR